MGDNITGDLSLSGSNYISITFLYTHYIFNLGTYIIIILFIVQIANFIHTYI